jgi:hypothetical protein
MGRGRKRQTIKMKRKDGQRKKKARIKAKITKKKS